MSEQPPSAPAPPPDPPDAGPATPDPPAAAPALVLLLTRPDLLVAHAGARRLAVLGATAVTGVALYGAVAGFFGGGWQIALAAAKAPLVLAAALLLCLPSFLVFHLLSGVELSPRRLPVAALGVAALLGLLFASLAPVGWLFSVTSRSVAFVALFHAGVWTVLVVLALRFLRVVLGRHRRPAASAAWALLLWVVALQVATYLGPILQRSPGEDAFALRRGLFLARWVHLFEPTTEPPAPSPDR